MQETKTYILDLWIAIIRLLGWVSPFQLINKILRKSGITISHSFVDTWVLSNLILSFLALLLFTIFSCSWIRWAFIIWASLRVLELVIYQFSILLVDQYESSKYALAGYRRILVLSLMNYVEILFWFAFFYRNWSSLFKDDYYVLATSVGSIYYSLVTMSTLGYGEVHPLSNLTRILVTLQLAISIILLVLIVSRIISYLPKPPSMDRGENKKESQQSQSSRSLRSG